MTNQNHVMVLLRFMLAFYADTATLPLYFLKTLSADIKALTLNSLH